MRFRCPHCNEFGHVRKTVRDEAKKLFASFYVRCSNLYCGHIWRMDTEASFTTRKSQMPDASVSLPQSKHVKSEEQRSAEPRAEHRTHYLPGFQPPQEP